MRSGTQWPWRPTSAASRSITTLLFTMREQEPICAGEGPAHSPRFERCERAAEDLVQAERILVAEELGRLERVLHPFFLHDAVGMDVHDEVFVDGLEHLR